MTIDENGIRNSESVDLTRGAPAANKKPMQDKRSRTDETETEQNETHVGYKQTIEENFGNALREFFVECIMLQVGKFDNVNYVLGWSHYEAADHTVELSAHNLQHFISCCSADCRSKRQGNRYKEKEIVSEKERTAPTKQAIMLMTIYQGNSNKYQGT